MRPSAVLLIALFLPVSAAFAQSRPAKAPAVPPPPAAAASAPAPAGSAAAASPSVNLSDIRNFARVFQIVQQAYVEKKSNRTLMDAAIKGMLMELDPHSAYLDRKGMQELTEDTTGEYAGLGIVVAPVNGQLRIISPIDGTPAAKAGIRPGDVVLKVDGKPVDPDDVEASIQQLRGKPGTRITLTLLRKGDNQPHKLTLTRERINVPSVHVREIEPGYAYVRIAQFQENTAADLQRELSQLIAKHGMPKGLVLDLRSNPGGLLTSAVGVASTFLDGGTVVTTRGRLSDANLSFSAQPGDMLDGAPMVVLVDNGTASAAEIVAGALKDHHRGLIMGQRTFGKGVVQTVIPVDSTHAVKLTTARYYTPDGTSIQARGITPDIRLAQDLTVSKGDSEPSLIGSEADLPNHLANEHPASSSSSAAPPTDGNIALKDYALGEALNVLRGLVLAKRPPTLSQAGTRH